MAIVSLVALTQWVNTFVEEYYVYLPKPELASFPPDAVSECGIHAVFFLL